MTSGLGFVMRCGGHHQNATSVAIFYNRWNGEQINVKHSVFKPTTRYRNKELIKGNYALVPFRPAG